MDIFRRLGNKPLTGYGLYHVINWIRNSFVSRTETPGGLMWLSDNVYEIRSNNYQQTYNFIEVEKETTIVIATNGAVIYVPHSFIINNTSQESVTISFSSSDSSYEITSNKFEITGNSIIEITVMVKENKKIIVFR